MIDKKRMAAALRFKAKGKSRVAANINAGDRVHLDGDIEAHAFDLTAVVITDADVIHHFIGKAQFAGMFDNLSHFLF